MLVQADCIFCRRLIREFERVFALGYILLATQEEDLDRTVSLDMVLSGLVSVRGYILAET